jgi:hypothetical protein
MQLLTPVSSPPMKPTPFVRCRGSDYPFAPQPTSTFEDRTPVGSGDPLVDGLIASLASQLQMPFAPEESVERAVERYTSDHALLTHATEEVRRFLDQVLEQYLMPTTDSRIRDERRAVLLASLPLPKRPPHHLSAEFLAKPSSEVMIKLRAAIDRAVRELIGSFIACLQRLVQQCVCGLIDRPRSDLGRFTFFTEELTNQIVRRETRQRRKGKRKANSRVIGVDHVKTLETTTTHRRFTKHEHHLMDTTERSPQFVRWPLPTRVEEWVMTTPTWLRSQLRVVEGTVILERSVTWETTQTTTRVLAERDEPVFAPDPALILGDFVLTGWSEPEMPSAQPAQSTPLLVREMLVTTAAVVLGLIFWGLFAGLVRDPALRAVLIVTLLVLIHHSFRSFSLTPTHHTGASS